MASRATAARPRTTGTRTGSAPSTSSSTKPMACLPSPRMPASRFSEAVPASTRRSRSPCLRATNTDRPVSSTRSSPTWISNRSTTSSCGPARRTGGGRCSGTGSSRPSSAAACRSKPRRTGRRSYSSTGSIGASTTSGKSSTSIISPIISTCRPTVSKSCRTTRTLSKEPPPISIGSSPTCGRPT